MMQRRNILFGGAVMLSGFIGGSAVALDESRLWLPTKYHKLYLDLKESAMAAEKLDVCTEILRGSLDLDQSQPGKPIFIIRCRKADGRSYNEMVDGTTKETLTTKPVVIEVLSAEEVEQIRLAEEQRLAEQREKRKVRFRHLCLEKYKEKTALMIQMKPITPDNVEPIAYEGEAAEFNWDFDAWSLSGRKLQYRANCVISEGVEPAVKLKARP